MNRSNNYKLCVDFVNLPFEILPTSENARDYQPPSTIRLRFLLQLTSFFLAHVESLLQDMQFCHTLFDVLLHCPVLYTSSVPTHSSDPSAHNSLLRNQSFRIDAFSLRLTETPPSSLDVNTTRAAYDCQDHWEISCVSQLRWHIPSV